MSRESVKALSYFFDNFPLYAKAYSKAEKGLSKFNETDGTAWEVWLRAGRHLVKKKSYQSVSGWETRKKETLNSKIALDAII